MSKINLNVDNEKVAEIENKIKELNEYFVLVKIKNIKELQEANIPYYTFIGGSGDYYLVKRGRKTKKFNEEQIKLIKTDLKAGLSIRKCAIKYDTSTSIIQKIKKDEY